MSSVSFEFFPPRTPEMETALWAAIEKLAPLRPDFVSVTYGAGGSTRERTHATVKRIVDRTELRPAAHLTCVAATREEINEVVRGYWDAGVRHIVALRGDMPGGGPYRAHEGGYESTPDLVRGIRALADFEASVSCYPEKHPDSASFEADLDLLKEKIEAGARRAITQFCFVEGATARLRDRAHKAGVRVPIVPGLMPATNFKGVVRMAEKCGATIPDSLRAKFDGLDDDPAARKRAARDVLVSQIKALQREGFDAFHFYTLNQADLTYEVCRNLDLTGAR